ncbi:MAG: YwaF family protein [Saprospiraceae bacterium]|nr:YwaF family protein [Saprospiraceae bacterium]
MLDIFLLDNSNFRNYGWEHGVCFIGCIAFITYILYTGKKNWNTDQQKIYITIICAFGAFTQLFKVVYKYNAGIFDQTNDFPLHLCNIMTLVMPFYTMVSMEITLRASLFLDHCRLCSIHLHSYPH